MPGILVLLCLAVIGVHAQPSKLLSRGMGGGGALFHPSIGPAEFEDMYVSCDMGGVYRSGTLGGTWTLLDFRQICGGGYTGKVQFTRDWSTLYAITNKDEEPRTVKSTNGGFTWVATTDPTNRKTYTLFADPRQTTMLIVSSDSAMWLSNDGGQTFVQRYMDKTSRGCHIAGVFFDMPNIYIGTNAGLLVSTNGGTSFTLDPLNGVPAGEAMVSFTGARTGTTTRLLCVTLGTGDVYPGVTGAEYVNFKNVYTTTVGSGSWTAHAAALPAGARPFFCAMAVENANIAWLAGGSVSGVPTVLKTTDGGGTWTTSFITTNNQNILTGWSGQNGDRDWTYGEYALGLSVSPTDPSRVAFTDLGFVHVTRDGGTTWKQAYLAASAQNPAGAPTPKGRAYQSNGMENTSVWNLLWADPNTIIGCYTDIRAAISTDGGGSWSQNFTGHTLNTMYHAIKHPGGGVIYAATSSVHDIYESTHLTDAALDGGQGKVLFSLDTGRTWQTLHDFLHPVIWLAMDPTDPNRMYASVVHSTAGGIYMTNDVLAGAASQWVRVNAPPRTEGHPYNVVVLGDGSLVCTYSGRRSNNAFTASSGVFYSTDHGNFWQDRSANPGMHYWTKDITIDPSDLTQNTWYVGVYSGWGGASNSQGGLYRTTDRGMSWNKILIRNRVQSCTFHPSKTPELFVTTEGDGLLYTYDVRGSNPSFYSVANYPFAHPTRVIFNPYNGSEVWIASFGFGLMTGRATPVPVELTSLTAGLDNGLTHLAWSTESETVNAGFGIQRRHASDAAWTEIGFVPGAGTTSGMHRYTFIDRDPARPGTTEYRLAQRDLDGTETLSHTVSVTAAAPARPAITSVFPSPIHGVSTVQVSLAEAGPMMVEVINVLGQRVATLADGVYSAGTHALHIDGSAPAPGLYLIRMSTAAGTSVLPVQTLR